MGHLGAAVRCPSPAENHQFRAVIVYRKKAVPLSRYLDDDDPGVVALAAVARPFGDTGVLLIRQEIQAA